MKCFNGSIHGNWNKYIEHVIGECFFSECSPGYSGPGCFIACPYPLYGENCQNICNCSATESCNFMFGCLESKYIKWNNTCNIITKNQHHSISAGVGYNAELK